MSRFSLAFLTILVGSLATVADEEKKSTPATSDLPGKGKITWNLTGLGDRFTVVKTRHEPEARKVSWLLEAKTDLTLKPSDLATGLFDEDRVRLGQEDLEIEGGIADAPPVNPVNPQLVPPPPPVKVQKGERIRINFTLPEEVVWDKVRYVVVASKAIPAEPKDVEKK